MQVEAKVSTRNVLLQRFLAVSVFAVLTGVAAQIRIPLPFSPVPVTGQTFVVLFAPLLVDQLAGYSQIVYLLLGALGVPWFSDHRAGIQVLLGPTGGYLLGFIVASFLLGGIVKKYKILSAKQVLIWLAVVNFAVIYSVGLIQLYLWFALKGATLNLYKLLSMGFLPFIPGDLIKISLAAGVYSAYKRISK
ncbi:MAG: biotin transporter BioY [Pseudothermotoga sp.]